MKETKVTLYSKTSSGAIQEWTIVQSGDNFYTIEGQYGGKMTTSKPTICKPKNVGKISETTGEQQAISESISKIQLKLDKGYVYDMNDVHASAEIFHSVPSTANDHRPRTCRWQALFAETLCDRTIVCLQPQNSKFISLCWRSSR